MISKILKIIFPEDYCCYVCGQDIFDNKRFVCDVCLKKLPYLTGNICLHCSNPFDAYGNYCKRCKGKKFVYDRAIAPFIYDNEIKNMIFGLKYDNKKYYAKCLGHFMAEVYKKSNFYADIIIPVPLCESRLKQRGYNQSKVLADEICKHININVKDDILFRVKETITQTALDYVERQNNLKDAFKVKNAKKIKDKFILLVDDVFTTGATITECAKVLKKAGARVVYVVTAAHTVFKKI